MPDHQTNDQKTQTHNAPVLEAKVHKGGAVDARAGEVEDLRLEEHHGALRQVEHAAGLRAVPALAPVLEGLHALRLRVPVFLGGECAEFLWE